MCLTEINVTFEDNIKNLLSYPVMKKVPTTTFLKTRQSHHGITMNQDMFMTESVLPNCQTILDCQKFFSVN